MWRKGVKINPKDLGLRNQNDRVTTDSNEKDLRGSRFEGDS